MSNGEIRLVDDYTLERNDLGTFTLKRGGRYVIGADGNRITFPTAIQAVAESMAGDVIRGIQQQQRYGR